MSDASIHEIPTLPSPITPAALPESDEEPEPPTIRRVSFDDDDERFFRDGESSSEDEVGKGREPHDERRPLMKPVGAVVLVAALLCVAALGRSLPAAAATAPPACVEALAK